VSSALRRARDAVRARWPHPFHWAAFQGYARTEL
jgi:CHAT domain-containing protein